MKKFKVVKFIKTIIFLQAMRKRVLSKRPCTDNMLDLDDKICDKIDSLRQEVRTNFLFNQDKKLASRYRHQFDLACRLLNVDKYTIY